MSKIICDVCGTAYPETATQCPICGCVRSVDARTVAGNTNEAEAEVARAYTHVKGGRFSKSNVKKRNSGKPVASVEVPVEQAQTEPEDSKKETGIIVTTVIVLMIIIAVVAYIALRFFVPNLLLSGSPKDTNPVETPASTADVTADTTDTIETTPLEIPCEEIVLSKTTIIFDSADSVVLLNATVNPADTTDLLSFAISDESVATVTKDGKVTSVGGGEAVITVTCGTAVAECNVICTIEDPEEETTEEVTISPDEFELNREDFTLNSKGDTWKLYSGDIAANQITWTSDDENVATIKDGVVTAVGSGMTTVYGEYGGVELSCIVRCSEAMGKADATTSNSDSAPETTAPKGDYTISNEDVTLVVGESFDLVLKDADGNAVEVTWTASDSSICEVSGNTVTGLSKGNITVKTAHDGAEYACIVRVVSGRG